VKKFNRFAVLVKIGKKSWTEKNIDHIQVSAMEEYRYEPDPSR
jgi:hypothetical protein